MSDETAKTAAVRRQQWIEALMEERRGYVAAGKADRVADVDKALKDAGHSGPSGRRGKPSETTEG